MSKQNQTSAEPSRSIVTVEEQIRQGVRRPAAPANYVPPSRNPQPLQVLPPVQSSAFTIDAAPHATQHIEFKSSHIDRADGFRRIVDPLAILVAFVVLLVAILSFKTPWFSIAALLIFVSAFVAVYLAAWLYTVSLSPEATSHYEARRKWDIVANEQRARWNYYNRMNDPRNGE